MDQNHTLIIAEIGSNHDQSLDQALEMIRIAADCGADAVKFQSIHPDKLIRDKEQSTEDRQLFRAIQLKESWYPELFGYCKKVGILGFSAPTYLEAVPLLVNQGVRLLKIASPQTFGFPKLIQEVAQTNLPTLMSTGYCLWPEIQRAVDLFAEYGDLNNLTLLHCVSEYPTPYEHVNLRFMERLKQFHVNVGLSDHTLGTEVAVAAVARGATVIEKHLTISRTQRGPDHYFALEPEEFRNMVNQIRNIEQALGTGCKESLTEFELEFRKNLVMYPCAAHPLKAGDKITEEDLCYYRSKNRGISPWDIPHSFYIKCDLSRMDQLQRGDIIL